MASVMIIYGSSTGNTSFVAEKVGELLQKKGAQVKVEDVSQVNPEALCNGYDAILFGCSTWGYEDVELQEDFDAFMPSLDKTNVKHKNVAVFGCGDVSYTHFCGAVDEIETSLEALGANFIAPSLKIDGDPDSSIVDIDKWAEKIAEKLQ